MTEPGVFTKIIDSPVGRLSITEAGSTVVRRAVHEHLDQALMYSCAVGATHWDTATVGQGVQNLPGPKPTMFFAPSQIQKRIKQWGREQFDARLGMAWQDFLGAASSWISIERGQGVDALARVYQSFIDGSADPAKGFVMTLQSSKGHT